MQQASFRFYAELNDLLPLSKRKLCFSHAFEASASVKDIVEAFGIPHTEVDLVLANGEAVTFSYLLRDGDRISVYPVFRSLDLSPLTRLQPRSGAEMCFVLDTHLGKLAAYLRMLGFDSVYRNDCRDEELRILQTSSGVSEQGSWFTEAQPSDSRLPSARTPAARTAPRSTSALQPVRISCPIPSLSRLQHPVQVVPKDLISHRLPPESRKHYDEFHVCPGCNRLYWKGSHYQRMAVLIERMIDLVNPAAPKGLDH